MLQVMLYHRLLSSLVCKYPKTGFSFVDLWSRLHLNSQMPLSDRFLRSVTWEFKTDRKNVVLESLYDLQLIWENEVQAMAIEKVDSTVELVYHHQSISDGKKHFLLVISK